MLEHVVKPGRAPQVQQEAPRPYQEELDGHRLDGAVLRAESEFVIDDGIYYSPQYQADRRRQEGAQRVAPQWEEDPGVEHERGRHVGPRRELRRQPGAYQSEHPLAVDNLVGSPSQHAAVPGAYGAVGAGVAGAVGVFVVVDWFVLHCSG